ncbi:hypothetical protein [Dyadobacter sp. BHUBP1]|uniref:hypothetical protein n=1 Tax=Dyadobacter sp. BHUBP1 TaxID=3424178 RepID=UPI003D34A230
MLSFFVVPTSTGYSFSYTSLLGHLITKAETLYGERDKSYTILGVEIMSDEFGEAPQVWYPGNCKHIAIRITSSCLGHLGKSVYQLAHETIHCLFPSGGAHANYLEEGLAVHFALECAKEYSYFPKPSQRYQEAFELVDPILKQDRSFIKKLRERELSLYRISRDLIIELAPDISPETAENLVTKF